MTRYVVRGHFTPTDFSHFTDRPELPYSAEVTEVECETLAEAESELAWYPDGEIERRA